jgi:hypothetical protein
LETPKDGDEAECENLEQSTPASVRNVRQDPPVEHRHEPPTDEILRFWPPGKSATRPGQRGGTVAQWLHIARQVLGGEFEGADSSTRESLLIGLRSIAHPDARQALARLSGQRQ